VASAIAGPEAGCVRIRRNAAIKPTAIMKTRILLLASLAAAAFLGVLGAQQQTEPDFSTQEAMRVKLRYAQQVLEGIAVENFGQIETNAVKLARLSRLTGWRARQTPEYELFTNEFRRQADAMADAARVKNLDAATLAYVQLTFSCTSCHRHMRGAQRADWKLPDLNGPQMAQKR